MAAPQHMEVPRLGCQIGATTANLHHSSRQRQSLTHWARPGMESASSWLLVRFVSAVPQRELLWMTCLFPPLLFTQRKQGKGRKWDFCFCQIKSPLVYNFSFFIKKKIAFSQEVRFFTVKVRIFMHILRLSSSDKFLEIGVLDQEVGMISSLLVLIDTKRSQEKLQELTTTHNSWDGMNVLWRQTPCLFVFVSP